MENPVHTCNVMLITLITLLPALFFFLSYRWSTTVPPTFCLFFPFFSATLYLAFTFWAPVETCKKHTKLIKLIKLISVVNIGKPTSCACTLSKCTYDYLLELGEAKHRDQWLLKVKLPEVRGLKIGHLVLQFLLYLPSISGGQVEGSNLQTRKC